MRRSEIRRIPGKKRAVRGCEAAVEVHLRQYVSQGWAEAALRVCKTVLVQRVNVHASPGALSRCILWGYSRGSTAVHITVKGGSPSCCVLQIQLRCREHAVAKSSTMLEMFRFVMQLRRSCAAYGGETELRPP